MILRILLVAAALIFAARLVSGLLRTRRFSFAGKAALITGGSRGLGLVIARQFCRSGANVALIARNTDELARAKSELDRYGTQVLTIQCDLLESVQIQSAVRQTLDLFGKIDILVNNAGIIEIGPLNHMRREDFERSMHVHFWAPFELLMQIVPEMRRIGGGRIVNISSIGGKIAVPHMAPYSASKFALTGLSDAIRAELALDKIYVTTVSPGMMRTGSQGHAKFKGNHTREYKWFETSSKLPFASISAERAAGKILAACAKGEPALIMPLPAYLIIASNALFPNLSGRIMKMVNKRLPSPVGAGGNDARAGSEIRPQ
jgi:short-subunit dehydrogenase